MTPTTELPDKFSGRKGGRLPIYERIANTDAVVQAAFPPKLLPLFQPARYKVIHGGRGGAKAIAVSERIPTPTGWMRLGDIQIGDQVFDEAGRPCRVTEIHDDPHPESCYRMHFSDGATLDCNGAHEWVTWTHAERKSFLCSPYDDSRRFPEDWPNWRRHATPTGPQIRTTQDIMATLTYGKRGDLNHCIPLCAALDLPDVDLPIEPYVLGYWLANGGARDGNVTTGSWDGKVDHPDICAQFDHAGYPLVASSSGPWISDRLRRELRQQELLSNKHVPTAYLRASAPQRLALLRGLMDGDGTCCETSRVSFSNTNKTLAESVFELVLSLGEKATMLADRAMLYGKDCGECWTVAWRPSFNPFTLPRKAQRVRAPDRQALRSRHRMITAIAPIAPTPMRCLTVDGPNHMYLVSKWMIPTHNSWSIARALLLIGQQVPIRVLCARETMTSIAASVHQLLSDQIYALALQDHYDISNAFIRGRNGTEFRFAGMHRNIQQIKSFEGLTIVWTEEAANVSALSWDTLIPTMRDEGFVPGTPSEIWVSFNPELETDETYRRFILDPPPDAVVIEMNWRDNPWFPPALRTEMETMRRRDYDKYLHVYEGQCRQFLDGAVYTAELKAAAAFTEDHPQSRICDLKYDPGYPVFAFLDLGWSDATAIWLVQKVEFAVHCLRYIEGSRRNIDSYIKELDALPYPIDTYYLPHDAKAKNLGTGRSIEEVIRAKGKKVSIVPQISITDGINAVRTALPCMLFDRDDCAVGLHALRHYRFEVIENGLGGFKDAPVHDRYSHACLTGDCLVTTEDGLMRIDQITPGIKVWTPAGYSNVTWAGAVKQTADLITIEANDRTLTCTPEHKIATNNGFLAADSIRYSDYILSGNEYSCYLIGLLSRVTHIGFRALITGETSGGPRDPVICTAPYGKTRMARFLTAITSTISTGIRSTTTLPISAVSPNMTTYPCMPSNAGPTELSTIPAIIVERKLLSGIDPTQARPGTSNMASKSLKIYRGLSASAKIRSVLSRLCRHILPAPSIVTRIAKPKCSDNDAAPQWVYDLTVENHACYQANGFLVSNSDAMRYCAVGLRNPKKRPDASKFNNPVARYSTGHATGWMSL